MKLKLMHVLLLLSVTSCGRKHNDSDDGGAPEKNADANLVDDLKDGALLKGYVKLSYMLSCEFFQLNDVLTNEFSLTNYTGGGVYKNYGVTSEVGLGPFMGYYSGSATAPEWKNAKPTVLSAAIYGLAFDGFAEHVWSLLQNDPSHVSPGLGYKLKLKPEVETLLKDFLNHGNDLPMERQKELWHTLTMDQEPSSNFQSFQWLLTEFQGLDPKERFKAVVSESLMSPYVLFQL
jgi:hypothetical protein